MDNRWIEWAEPFGPNDGTMYCRVSAETAIATIKAFAAAHKYIYTNDQTALEEFMAVHWAVFCVPPKEKPLDVPPKGPKDAR